MKEVKKLLVVLVAAVFFIGLFVLCDKYSENVKADYASQICLLYTSRLLF